MGARSRPRHMEIDVTAQLSEAPSESGGTPHPDSAKAARKLRGGDLVVLRLFELAARNRTEPPSNDRICGVFGDSSSSSAVRSLRRLEAAGYITLTHLGRNGRIVAARDGSWSVANDVARAIQRQAAGPQRAKRKRRPAHQARAAAARSAEQAPADGNAGAPKGGEAATTAGASPAAATLMIFDEASPVPVEAWMRALAPLPAPVVRAHEDTADTMALRNQIAAVAARALGVRHKDCQWPLGEVSKPGFRFCGEPVVTGRPYCDAHCARAYVPKVKTA